MPPSNSKKEEQTQEQSRFWLLLTRFSMPVAFAAIGFAFSLNGRVTALEAGQVEAKDLECKIDTILETSGEKFTAILVELQALKGMAPPWLVDRIDKVETRVLKLEGEK